MADFSEQLSEWKKRRLERKKREEDEEQDPKDVDHSDGD